MSRSHATIVRRIAAEAPVFWVRLLESGRPHPVIAVFDLRYRQADARLRLLGGCAFDSYTVEAADGRSGVVLLGVDGNSLAHADRAWALGVSMKNLLVRQDPLTIDMVVFAGTRSLVVHLPLRAYHDVEALQDVTPPTHVEAVPA